MPAQELHAGEPSWDAACPTATDNLPLVLWLWRCECDRPQEAAPLRLAAHPALLRAPPHQPPPLEQRCLHSPRQVETLVPLFPKGLCNPLLRVHLSSLDPL